MKKLNFTFLSVEQAVGDRFCQNQLDILEKYGEKGVATDFARLLGANVSISFVYDKTSPKDLTVGWWATDQYFNVSSRGGHTSKVVASRDVGARPVFAYSSISSLQLNKVRGAKGILEVEYGEYPQTVVSKDFSGKLEKEYLDGTINKTGKKYITDSCDPDNSVSSFSAKKHIEYEYNGKKYIRFVAGSRFMCILSDGRTVQKGEVYWVEVEPIKWMIDEKANIALSKYVVFSGVQFHYGARVVGGEYKGDFKATFIYSFMNNVFAKDIIPSVITKEAEPAAAKLRKLEQLQQELKRVQEEKTRLIAKESELVAQITQKQSEIQGKGPYVKQQ